MRMKLQASRNLSTMLRQQSNETAMGAVKKIEAVLLVWTKQSINVKENDLQFYSHQYDDLTNFCHEARNKLHPIKQSSKHMHMHMN